MRWVNGGAMPLAANKSSAGFVNPPMIEYLYAAALRIWPDILSVSILTMVSGMTAVAAAGWAAYRVFGRRAALWSALIFAVNPWSVLYSQLIWNQTMVPVFSSLMLVGLLLYFAVEQQPRYLILSFACAGCMTQVHPGSIVQLLTMGLTCVLFWRKLKIWPLVVGGVLFVLSYVPYVLYESNVGWQDVKAALESTRQSAPLTIASLLVSIDLLHAKGLFASAACVGQFDGLVTALLALSLIYALWAGTRAFLRRHHDPEAKRAAAAMGILLLWFTLPILLYLRSSHYLQIYYLISQVPAHFLLMGVSLDGAQRALERLAGRVPRGAAQRVLRIAARVVLPLPLLTLLAWQTWFNLAFQNRRFASTEGPTQVRHVRAAIKTSRELLSERPECTLVAISKGHLLEVSELSVLREFVSQERVLLSDGRLAISVPGPCAAYLDGLPGSRASSWLGAQAVPLPGAKIPVRGEIWQFYDLPAAGRESLLEGAGSQTQIAAWTNGVALMHYERGPIRPGATLPLTLTWSVEASPAQVIYHFGTYLLTTDDQVVAQSDGPGFDSIQWRAGDAFITWFDIPVPQDLPPGRYRIGVALYSWPALERVDLTAGRNTAFLEQLQVSEP